jgi:hypothetical protein
MLAYRFDFYVPRSYNDGSPIEDEKFVLTRREIIQRLRALSWMGDAGDPPIQGFWEHEGTEYYDRNDWVTVCTPREQEHKDWFQAYKETLKERFQQLEIFLSVKK